MVPVAPAANPTAARQKPTTRRGSRPARRCVTPGRESSRMVAGCGRSLVRVGQCITIEFQAHSGLGAVGEHFTL